MGDASLNLMLKSTAKVTDLQVTVTEVRPGGHQEEYITSGFLRSSNRTLTSASTALDPVPTYLGADKKNLPAGTLHPGPDPRRSHRPHLPGRDESAHRDLGPRR